MTDKQGCTHARAYTRPRVRGSTRMRARAHTHTDKYVTLNSFSTATIIRECVSVLRYAFTACLVVARIESYVLIMPAFTTSVALPFY